MSDVQKYILLPMDRYNRLVKKDIQPQDIQPTTSIDSTSNTDSKPPEKVIPKKPLPPPGLPVRAPDQNEQSGSGQIQEHSDVLMRTHDKIENRRYFPWLTLDS